MLNGEIDANDLELELGNHNSLEGEIVETQGLEGEIQGQTEKVNGVDIYGELLDNGIVKYDGTIQKLRTILADTQLDANSHNVVENQAVASKVNEIETDIDNIGTEVDNISQRVTTAEGEISTLSSEISTISGDVADIQGEIGTINQEITTIEGNVSNLQQNKQDKVDNSLETSDKTVSGAINELKSAIDNIDVSIDGTTITRNSNDELQAVAITDGETVIDVDDIENIREIAAGKESGWVIDSQSQITGTKDSEENYTNVTAITGLDLSLIKVGDNIYIINTQQPDYWVSGKTEVEDVITLRLNTLTTKVDLTNYVDKTSNETISGNKTFTGTNTFTNEVKLSSANDSGIFGDQYGNLKFKRNGSVMFSVANYVGAGTNNSTDLGSSSVKWRDLYLGRDLYLSGSLKDGINEISIANIANKNNIISKPTSTSSWQRVVGFNAGSLDTQYYYASNTAAGNTFAMRTANGRLKVVTPTENDDATTKLYVDTKVDTKQDKLPYISLERLGAYLYKVSFDTIPEYQTLSSEPLPAGCTSFVRDGKLYRNLDWNYDNTAEFLIQTKNFRGMAFITGLNDSAMDSEKVGQLPYHINDGVNNDGIMVSTHVLYNDWQYAGNGDKNVPISTIPLHILNELHDIDDISTVLGTYLSNIQIPTALQEMGYLLQFIVTDGTTTYALLPPESASGAYQVVDITSNPKLTNFRWVNRATVVRTENDIQTRPTGIERWNLIGDDTTLEDLRFTLAYESPTRLSEFIGLRDTTKDSTDQELTEIYNLARAEYLDRERDGTTWQSVHSIIYGDKGIEHLWVQEDYDVDYASVSGDVDLSNYVDLDSAQTITGLKTFGIKPRVLCSSDLPSEYQEVEYLESQGEQWIDIGIDYDTIGSKLSVETSIYYDQTITSNQYIFGSAASSGRYLNPRIETNNTMTVVTGGGSANLVIQGISIGSFTKKDLTFEVDGKNFKVHANNRNYTGTASGTPTSTGNIALFGLNSASSSFAGRIYYFRLYDGTGTLIRNLVPCYRKSDNEAGVYDLVNDVFYTNSGEGAFTVGADVTSKEVLTENDLSWGNIKGTLANQTDLQSVLDSKMDDGDVAAVSGDSDNNNYLHKIKINGTTYDLPQFVKPAYNPERYGIGIGHGAFVRGYGITIGRNSGANFGGQNFLTIGAWSNIADRVINLGHDNKNTIPETFCFDGVAGSHGSGMTVEKANRTMLVYDTEHIFFRNEDLKNASSKSSYTNGRTLKQYLDEKANDLNVIHPSDVIDNVTSTDITKPLSANMGKELNDRIQNLAGIGKYLAMWDCTTGLPTTNPTTMPYSYTTGDYYVIKTVGTTNYMPNGSSYTGVASTTEYSGTEELSIGDFWLYDGTSWSFMKNSGRTVTFATISGSPTDNSNLASALNGKLDKVTTTSSTNEVYAKGSDGSQMRIPVAQSVINGSIALRGSSGNLKVGTPISTDDATTKDYVDNALSGKVDTTIKVNNKALSSDITLYGTDIKRNSSANTNIAQDITTINDNITSLDNAFTYLNGEVTTLQGTVSGHTSSISTINTMIGDIDTELETQQQSINNLSTSISNHTSQISTLQANDLAMASNITALQNNKEQIVASSFGENGYIKYNSGVIIQWGVYVLDQGNGRDKNIVFPTPFSSTNYGVVTSHYQGTISNDYINSYKIVDKASTYFTVRKHFSESGEKALYIAVGK